MEARQGELHLIPECRDLTLVPDYIKELVARVDTLWKLE
jgi:hypothetical protein